MQTHHLGLFSKGFDKIKTDDQHNFKNYFLLIVFFPIFAPLKKY